jgi:hypothetical protein
MRPITVVADSSGNTVAVPVDVYLTPINVSYVKTGSGTVQISYSDPWPKENGDFVAPTFTWVSAPSSPINGQPFRAIRLSGGAEGDTLTVIQAGVMG